MTSRNALLRSGKGLGIPGTARKEDKKTKLKVAAPAPEEDRQGHFALRKGVRCAGVHLIIDLHGAAVLAESHISIHTWPDANYAALDVFMCGSADPDACIPVLREAFSAKRVGVNEILRGLDD